MITIRPAMAADAPLILRFIEELADYEKAREHMIASLDDIQRSLFADKAQVKAVIAEVDQKPAGFAVFFYNYSTWQGQYGLYLEDLYVTPEQRGKGVGKALFQFLAQHALTHHCTRFEWSVLDWNSSAIKFYESMGAQPQSEWIKYRLDGEALMHMAQATAPE